MALKVLIVDDEALARSRLRTLLGDCTDPRAEVVGEAGNAVQAMDQIQRAPCDLLLLDIHMPGVDGMALAENLRSIAAPIFDRRGNVIAALNISTHLSRVSLEQLLQEFLPLLLQTVRRISQELPPS